MATLHIYVQHVGAGPGATEFTVAAAEITAHSPTSFGQVNVLDDKLTAGPVPSQPPPTCGRCDLGHLELLLHLREVQREHHHRRRKESDRRETA